MKVRITDHASFYQGCVVEVKHRDVYDHCVVLTVEIVEQGAVISFAVREENVEEVS